MRRGIVHTTLAVLAAIATSKSSPTAPPTTPYTWRNVRIDGGGFVTSTIFHPRAKGVAWVRTDMGGVYLYLPNSTTTIPTPLLPNPTSPSPLLPDSTTTGPTPSLLPDSFLPLQDDVGWGNQSLWGTLSLAADPANASRVFVACGLYYGAGAASGTVLRSEAGGLPGTWTASPLPSSVHLGGNEAGRSAGERLAVHPTNGSVVLLGTSQSGLFRSDDGGVTWAGPVPTGPGDDPTTAEYNFLLFADGAAAASAAAASAPSTLLFAGLRPTSQTSTGLYLSSDGGLTWAPVADAPPFPLIPYRASADAGGDFVYITFSNGIGPSDMSNGTVVRYSRTTGAVVAVPPVVDGGGGYAGVAADPSVPGTVVVTTLDRWSPDEIYRSVDAGNSWFKIGSTAAAASPDTPWIYWHRSAPSSSGWMGDVAIDPFDSAHMLHTTGQGLWTTRNGNALDPGRRGERGEEEAAGAASSPSSSAAAAPPLTWSFTNRGLEQTAVLALVSPPAPGAPLLSALGDIDGFVHLDLDLSPAQGMFSPSMGSTGGLDVAWRNPALVVRSHDVNPYSPFPDATHGGVSGDGGLNFTFFATEPPGARNAPVAVTCDGAAIVWLGHVSRDNGTTWTPCAGDFPSPSSSTDVWPVADRVNPRFVYAVGAQGGLFVSADAGATWSAGAANVPGPSAVLAPARASFAREGELWIPTSNGLFVSRDHGQTAAQVAGVTAAYSLGLGLAPASASVPASLYLHGAVGVEEGLFRSDDEGSTWARVNGWATQFGFIMRVEGDPKVVGRVYVGTNGRGVLVGEDGGAGSPRR
jgi:hypothetical protein